MMEKEIMKIIIQDEKSKEEIIYNHILSTLSPEEQIKYLKSKVLGLENDLKRRTHYIFLFLITFLFLCLGILLLAFDLYIFGIFVIFLVFVGIILRFMFMLRSYQGEMQGNEFDKVEELKKSLQKKLK